MRAPVARARSSRWQSRCSRHGLGLLRIAAAAGAMLAGAVVPQTGLAQAVGAGPPDARQLLGQRLFNQSCRICHTPPHLGSKPYGPELSRESLGGDENLIVEFIAEGTGRMPAFKHHFKRAEMEAIAAFLKRLPVSPASGSDQK